jgi:hypothetical protein
MEPAMLPVDPGAKAKVLPGANTPVVQVKLPITVRTPPVVTVPPLIASRAAVESDEIWRPPEQTNEAAELRLFIETACAAVIVELANAGLIVTSSAGVGTMSPAQLAARNQSVPAPLGPPSQEIFASKSRASNRSPENRPRWRCANPLLNVRRQTGVYMRR